MLGQGMSGVAGAARVRRGGAWAWRGAGAARWRVGMTWQRRGAVVRGHDVATARRGGAWGYGVALAAPELAQHTKMPPHSRREGILREACVKACVSVCAKARAKR